MALPPASNNWTFVALCPAGSRSRASCGGDGIDSRKLGWFNPAARGQTNLDVSLFKNFRVAKKVNIQFRAEAFNLTNTPAFFLRAANSTALTIGKPNFGRLTSSPATGREAQMALKILF